MKRLLPIILISTYPSMIFAQGYVSQTGNNAFTGSDTFTQINSTIYADTQSGADPCAKIKTALGLLPSTGGVIHAEGFTGAQSCASTLVLNKPVLIYWGAVALTLNGDPGIQIGNGTTTATSTVNSIRMVGVGMGGTDASAPPNTPTTKFIGVSGSTVISILGAIQGIDLGNFQIDGGAIGLQALGLQFSNLHDISIIQPTSIGMSIGVQSGSSLPAGQNGSAQTLYSNINVDVDLTSTATGIQLDGNNTNFPNYDTTENMFFKIVVQYHGGASSLGWRIKYADGNKFFSCSAGAVNSGGGSPLLFDETGVGVSGFPATNAFYSGAFGDLTHTITVTGTPGRNNFYDLETTNAQVVPLGPYTAGTAQGSGPVSGTHPITFGGWGQARCTPTYGTTVNVDASICNYYEVVVTNTTAFTMANPTNPQDGEMVTVEIRNASGGTMGAITWGGSWHEATFTNPANGFSRLITFIYNAAIGVWREMYTSSSDT